jgi:bifunctional UDP-N-acetylglucosamine pyrophosphorylase / glucosamine-1-phosphate N-acetyltransferase
LTRIVEERDCSPEQRKVRLSNGGLMALAGNTALSILDAIDNKNAKGEYYITDAVEIATRRGLTAAATTVAVEDVQGVNDRVQLAAAETVMQRRLRERHLLAGVTMTAPETVFLSYDTQLARDVTIEPHVVFGPGVKVGEGAVIHAFSHLEGAIVAEQCAVGPFARLRPGAKLGRKAKAGNFVEIKSAAICEGAKVNHLSYIGDAEVGANVNIGAGTITCNYDGFLKHKTTIGAGAFIGSNSALVAPVTIGEGAMTGSGSVITVDVPADALALGRGLQVVKEGWAKKFREKQAAKKKG